MKTDRRCFLCSAALSSSVKRKAGRKRKRVKVDFGTAHDDIVVQNDDECVDDNRCRNHSSSSNEQKMKVLLGYLLDTPAKQFDGVHQRVLKRLTSKTGENVATQFCCEGCEELGDNVLGLHLELEKVQMRLIDTLKTVRGLILLCRRDGLYPSKTKTARRNIRDDHDLLETFREAVCQAAETGVDIPLVYLEKFGALHHKPIHYEGEGPEEQKVNKTESSHVKLEQTSSEEEFDGSLPSPNDILQEDNNDNGGFGNDIISKVETAMETGTEEDPDNLQGEDEVKKLPRSLKKAETKRKSRVRKIGGRRQPKVKAKKRSEESNSQRVTTKKKIKIKSGTILRQAPSRIMTKYACELCPWSAYNVSRFEEHLRKHEALLSSDEPSSVSMAFNCDQCSSSFSTQQYYTFHRQRHEGIHKLKCDLCLAFIPGLEMIPHMKTHLEEIFPCPKCAHCFSSREAYLGHLRRSHEGGNLSCDICSQPFQTKLKLLSHLHDVHKAIQKVKCDFPDCGKSFLDSWASELHKISHSGRFTCDLCGKGFSAPSYLKLHQQRYHIDINVNVKLFKCEQGQCVDSFPTKAALQRHSIREHGAPKFECQYCQREFGTRGGLAFHVATVHEKTGIECPVCKKLCPTPSRLRVHMDNHDETRRHVCEECGKSFVKADSYYAHKALHRKDSEKRYRCAYCPSAFAIKKYLNQHTRIHTGIRPYVCQFCQKGFTQATPRNTHQRKCPSNNPNIIPQFQNPLAPTDQEI